ncbi:MAG: ABC-2 family transporter protein [Alicyclobacillus sp.]|nr:ABC-2 family transporter protein [Alicyclobacillus sp.]
MQTLREIRKHVHVYGLFLKNSLMSQMEYRGDFLITIVMELFWVCVSLAYLLVIYGTDVVIKGIPPNGMLIFFGSYLFVTGVFNALFLPNIFSIPWVVQQGTLDVYMTKPVSLQFYMTLRQVGFINPLPSIVTGVVMIMMGWSKLGIPFTLVHISVFILFLIVGIIMSYTVYLLLFLLSFWLVKVDALYTLFDTTWEMNNVPMTIYNKWITRIGVFLLPIFLIANFPALYLFHQLTHGYMMWSIVAPVLSLVLVRMLWRLAIRNYSGASG